LVRVLINKRDQVLFIFLVVLATDLGVGGERRIMQYMEGHKFTVLEVLLIECNS
jgi:hypothetical protein